MGAITVGPLCCDRSTEGGTPYSLILKDDPADGTGTIDYYCAWFVNSDGSNVDIGMATDNGSNSLTVPANGCAEGIGTVQGKNEWNAPGDFTAFNVITGQYIAIYTPIGVTIEREAVGSGMWLVATDEIPATQTYTWYADRVLSMHATGTTMAWANKILGVLFPAKVLSVANANIAKVMGVS